MNTILPVYYQIKNTINNWIINQEYKTGDKLPSENELAKIFNVSRLTVRRALGMLIQEGLLRSRRGEGTFVTDNESLINSFSLQFSGFMDDLFYQVSKSTTKSVQMSRIVPSRVICEKLELDSDEEEVVHIKRVRHLRDKPFAFTVNYLPLGIGERISQRNLYMRPLLQILEQDLGIAFSEAFQTIEASFSTSEIAEALGVPAGSPVLHVERIMYDQMRRPAELVQTSYRGDVYKYVVRLKRTKGKRGHVWVHQAE